MTERLKSEYERYLDRYGLKPRELPPQEEREKSMDQLVRLMYDEAKSRDDPLAESILTSFEEHRERHLAERRHPATVAIENAAADVEATIRAIPAFAEKFHDDVFVGEFPTGLINCQTVKVDGGFLVLVNSGTLMMLQQVVGFLCRGDAARPNSPDSLNAADGVAAVLAAYIEDRDPFYGPRPVTGGARALLAGSLSAAATKFVIAHEYGHILAGHLSDKNPDFVIIDSAVGKVDVLRKNHEQEFEADEIGYRLALGVADYDQFDLKAIDAAYNSPSLGVMAEATGQKSLIAAPFVPLTVDTILGRFHDTLRLLGSNPLAGAETHPPAGERMEKLVALLPGADPRYCSFVNIPFLLLPSVERIVGTMKDSVMRRSQTDNPAEKLRERDRVLQRRRNDIRRCVEEIQSGSNPKAGLLLAAMFEGERSIFEPDVDVVRRELVRGSLGQETDISRTLLDRHRERRGIEQYLKTAAREPSPASHLRGLFGMGNVSIDLTVGAASEAPRGLETIGTALEEAVSLEGTKKGEVDLLRALIFAWQGKREQALLAFEDALNAGITDTDGRLASFVSLEKRAQELGVELDIQKMLVAVGQAALRDGGNARELAELVVAYTGYLGVPLGPMAQRMIETQLHRRE